MTAAPAIKGWCPTLLSPMQSGDGWLARVKPSAGVLTAAAARLIADAARRHGNGHIDLTSRANLQVRGLSPRSAEDFAETIITAGLANTNPSLEAIRNVMASPLGPDDPSASFDSHAVASRHRSHALRRAHALGAAVQIRCPCRWRRRTAASRHHRRHHGARPRGEACRPPRRRDACWVVPPLAHRIREGSCARFPSPVCATEREAAPHARAGDGGRRGGDFRRCWSDRRPHASPTRARSKILHRIDIIGVSEEASSALACLSAASKPMHYTRLPASRSVTAMAACAPRAGARCC